jgi:hypothetical protein
VPPSKDSLMPKTPLLNGLIFGRRFFRPPPQASKGSPQILEPVLELKPQEPKTMGPPSPFGPTNFPRTMSTKRANDCDLRPWYFDIGPFYHRLGSEEGFISNLCPLQQIDVCATLGRHIFQSSLRYRPGRLGELRAATCVSTRELQASCSTIH